MISYKIGMLNIETKTNYKPYVIKVEMIIFLNKNLLLNIKIKIK